MSEPTFTCSFIGHHNFAIRDYARDDERGIRWLGEIKTILDEVFSANAKNLMAKREPTWGALFSMIDRVYEHQSAVLVGFFTGGWASMEVVVRAVIEASVTVIFVTQRDRPQRLGAYIANYFDASRRAIERIGEGSDAAERLRSLEIREDLMRNAHLQEGLPFDRKGWPSTVFDRFKAVGMETEYRHIYNVLSSQAHNDAESLVDYVIVRCLSANDKEMEALAAAEMLFWMRFYLYSGLRYYALAANAVATGFHWLEAATEITRVEREIFHHLEDLSRDFRALDSPDKR